MTTDHMKFFMEVAKCLSFSEAAEHLYISQSALSRQIISLESELGVCLFIRRNNSVKLTAEGRFMQERVSKIYSDICTAVRDVRSANDQGLGSLKIGFLMEQNIHPCVNKTLSSFTKDRHVTMNLFSCGFMDLRDGISDNTLDIAFSLNLMDLKSEHIRSVSYIREKSVVVLPNMHPLAHLETIRFKDLGTLFSQDNLLLCDPLEYNAKEQNSMSPFLKYGFKPKTIFCVYPMNRALMVSGGLGITIVNISSSIVQCPAVTAIPLEGEGESYFELTVEYNKNNVNPLIPVFMAQLLQNAATTNGK